MENTPWEFYEDKKKEWRWRHKASNGKIVAASSEGYKAKTDAVKNAEHYGYGGKFNNTGKWEFYKDKKEEWRWRHTATNGKIIGAATEGYKEKTNAIKNASSLGYKA